MEQTSSLLFQFLCMFASVILSLLTIAMLRPRKYRRNIITGQMERVRKYRDPLEDIKRQ